MVHKKWRFFIVLAGLLAATAMMAEESSSADVAGSWTSVSVKKQWQTGLGFNLHAQYRTTDNIRRTDCAFFRGYLTYAPCKYVGMAVAYDFLLSGVGKTDDPYVKTVRQTHRLLADLSGQYGYKGWTFSLRERYVMAWSGTYGHLLRTYPQVSYHIGESRWTPFVAAELFNSLKPGDDFRLQQTHLFAGTSMKINQVHSFRWYYVCQLKHTVDKRVHTLGVDYVVTLP